MRHVSRRPPTRVPRRTERGSGHFVASRKRRLRGEASLPARGAGPRRRVQRQGRSADGTPPAAGTQWHRPVRRRRSDSTSRFGTMLGRGRRARGTIALLVVALLAPAAVAARPAYRAHALPPGSEQAPATDCTAAVGDNVNTTPPGYRVPDDVLGTTCVP